ncbi:TIGR02680 family protein [Pseudorhodoferax sp. LjRoot39]|uniref:TIGR02680 family protein n=1 Tax=Pseudorhodoferax sp. LjRoot39 TaxID=3342328 RepID=UPI003ED0B525
MTDTLTDAPALPQPRLARWQPLRLGLVELFHYDSEEFWFKDGHLLLRGNNGTGKSKVLSLTLPFLFDAQLKSSRIEPDGDAGKKMAWNLLLGRHDRRMGYTWIEFGRVDEAGQPHYLTLGCGLSAAAARPQVDSWFFVQEGARVGQDFWLIGPSRVVLTRERLRDTLAPLGGQLFDTAAAYRRAVDERLFHLGAVRYGALMDTLIQLRQPQLSKKPDEANLSNALSEALPPMSTDLLGDVADALNELETYRRELDEYEALARAVGQFNQRYQVYAATQARRQARGLRSAQTGFDNASRELNEGRAALAVAQADEAEATQAQADAERQLQASRVRLEELLNDPANNAARQLDLAERDASRRQSEAQQALRAQADTQARLSREQQASRERGQRAAQAGTALERTRADTQAGAQRSGLAPACAANPLLVADVASLAPAALDAARHELRQSLAQRREHVTLLLRRCREAEEAAQARARQQALRDERQDEAEAAAAAREEADTAAQAQAEALVDAWQACLADLRQLQVAGDEAVLDALASWAASLQGDNPARTALHAAQQAASLRLAERQAALNTEQQRIDDAQALLQAERTRLERGEDATPPPPHWRAAEARATTNQRAGAPLWQLLDFHPQTDPAQHAGLEAALQAAGLLDAWVTPDGLLHRADGTALLHDAQWLARPRQPWSLAAWLQPAELPDHAAAVPAATVQALLEGVGCGPHDDGTAEAWIQPDGRFRLGALAGAWSKPAADFIGYAARAAARARRLQQIAAELAVLAQARAQCAQDQQRLAQDRQQAEAEWRSAPADDALRAAHADAAACARAFQAARERLDQAERQLQAATAQRDAARQALVRDAEDLQLPPEREPLHAIEAALQSFADTLHALAHAALALRDALHEHGLQQQREHDALADADQAAAHAAEREAQAEEARIRLQTLRESVGAKVEELQARLRVARDSVDHSQQHTKGCEMALREAGEARARAGQKTQDADAVLAERSATRQQAVAHLQGFAATGLLATALPAADIPPQQPPWTIEAALTLARSSEQALSHVKDDDEAWTRVQSLVSQDYTELGRALAALSHQAQAETHDYGLVVSIVYQNRPERPDQLGARLAAEIAQRRELLTAGERQVLENHLQAEIAAAVRRLLLDAERQVDSINTELAKRPTSTGVRFRLQWQPLPEGADGAPVGLEAARKRLLNTSTDLWTAEDRRVVGEMLQQRIAAERARADAGLGGSLLEQLARALDYRRWHRFRVQRWQDGQWRPLSGPASSGERALGLTVPLFAAVSSYYSQDGATLAPRLVLLDEAFAGIDDAARAHCMGLVREFDLDFVITSEREWACYAELPGVAIAQLQRREGVDAVHVSRWTWDGRARRREDDPDRRFPAEA